MGLIRLLIFLLVIWLIWRMVQIYRAEKARKNEQSGQRALSRQRMVKCDYCNIHLPQSDALSYDEHWFCSQSHKAKFLDAERH